VAAAFKLDHALPVPKASPQPAQSARRSRTAGSAPTSGSSLGAGRLLAQLLWIFILGGRTVLDQRLVFSPPTTTSRSPRKLPARARRAQRGAAPRHRPRQQLARPGPDADREDERPRLGRADRVAYWHGSDGGESWSEGDRSRELVFRDLPAGTYYFVIDPEISAEKPVDVTDRIKIVRDQAAWSNFFFLLVFLALFPMFSRYRVSAFEAERWKDADFLSSGAEFGSRRQRRCRASP
jgi:hypothetical protein